MRCTPACSRISLRDAENVVMTMVPIAVGETRQRYSTDEIGGKAANLARMAALGFSVPPAFVVPISVCARINAGDRDAERELDDGLREGIVLLERATGRRFGDRRRPLLVSVRSGAARAMPGMMATVLDVGATLIAVSGLVRMTGDPRFAWDCRQRFIESFGTAALGIDASVFSDARDAIMREEEDAANPRDLDGEAMERLAVAYQTSVNHDGALEDPMGQLTRAAHAVFASWMSDRAQTYRRVQHLEDLQGTAVTVQTMVFGNRGQRSGAGVAFSRDPSTGEPHPLIEVLFGAQGEEIVSGRRTPDDERAIARGLPRVGAELRDALHRLERDLGDVQDVEFTIEDGRLWLLQTRAAKRTPLAALRIAIDLVREKVIAPRRALELLAGVDLDAIARARFDDPGEPIARGVGASSGVASGRAVFDLGGAQRLAAGGDPIILVRPQTSTEDIAGIAIAAGIVTSCGGRTAHAALVARDMGKPSVVGCSGLDVDVEHRRASFAAAVVNEGEWISIDGDSGSVYLGARDVIRERPTAEIEEVRRWQERRSPH